MHTPTLTTNRIPTREERKAYGMAARAIYEARREQLEREHWGEYLVIHPGNGDYVVAVDEEEALEKMRSKYPGILFFTIRIGYRSEYHFGASGLTDGKRPRENDHDDNGLCSQHAGDRFAE